MTTLNREVTAWQKRCNKACRKAVRHFTTVDARIRLRRLYPVEKEQNQSTTHFTGNALNYRHDRSNCRKQKFCSSDWLFWKPGLPVSR